MVEKLDGFPDGVVAIRATGKVTRSDYGGLIVPAVEEAIATDESQISGTVQMFAFVIPCPVQVFALAGFDDAKDWILQ